VQKLKEATWRVSWKREWKMAERERENWGAKG